MRIETNQDHEAAIARLASRTPKTLATFIASLAFDSGPIGEQVRTFIVGDCLFETAASLKERISTEPGALFIRSNQPNTGDDREHQTLVPVGYLKPR